MGGRFYREYHLLIIGFSARAVNHTLRKTIAGSNVACRQRLNQFIGDFDFNWLESPVDRSLLQVMQTPRTSTTKPRTITIILGGMVFSMAFNSLSNRFGRQSTPLFFLIFAVITNVVLDLVFIQNFGMGVAGAACHFNRSAGIFFNVTSTFCGGSLLQLKEDFHLTKLRCHLFKCWPTHGFPTSIIAIGP